VKLSTKARLTSAVLLGVVALLSGRSTSPFAAMKHEVFRPAAPYAALLLRVTLGSMFLAHLYWKFEILPGGVHTWWSSLSANGYPRFVLWYALSAEFAGALLLIPGIYTRCVSLYALPLMVGASHFWLVHKGFYFTAAGAELPLVWSIMLILQAMLGDGPHAVGSGTRFP
jgi:putative oxidoreductase